MESFGKERDQRAPSRMNTYTVKSMSLTPKRKAKWNGG